MIPSTKDALEQSLLELQEKLKAISVDIKKTFT